MKFRSGVRETVLYYSPEKKPYDTKLKGLMIRMGIRIKPVSPAQAGERIDSLLGLPVSENPAHTPEPAHPAAEASHECAGMNMPEELLVLHNFSRSRLDELLAAMRRGGIPKIGLKAVLTETNRRWTLEQLYREIEEEHRNMTARPEGGKANV